MVKHTYGTAIRAGFDYLLKTYPNVFVMGQGLWSPWYVGSSMTDLEKVFGLERVIDTPVSEAACTGAAIGASLAGMRPIVVHPRMDFLLYGMDAIVNQAAKWAHMFGCQASSNVTIRAIINRGGEQGAQHSQSLHSWFAHTPGLRVVMPYSVADARDLLIASVLCDDPTIFIDDRWLYEQSGFLPPVTEQNLLKIKPRKIKQGVDLTIVSSGYSCLLAERAAEMLQKNHISVDVIDNRILNPIEDKIIIESVRKTGRLLVIDGGTQTCGYAGEVIARISEQIEPFELKNKPIRVTLPDTPAPTSSALEKNYYPDSKRVFAAALSFFKN